MTPHRIPAENLRSRSPVGVLKQRERDLPESDHNCPRRVFEWFRQEVADRPSLPCSTSGFPECCARGTLLTLPVSVLECEPTALPFTGTVRSIFHKEVVCGDCEKWQLCEGGLGPATPRPAGKFRYKSAGEAISADPATLLRWGRTATGISAGCGCAARGLWC